MIKSWQKSASVVQKVDAIAVIKVSAFQDIHKCVKLQRTLATVGEDFFKEVAVCTECSCVQGQFFIRLQHNMVTRNFKG